MKEYLQHKETIDQEPKWVFDKKSVADGQVNPYSASCDDVDEHEDTALAIKESALMNMFRSFSCRKISLRK